MKARASSSIAYTQDAHGRPKARRGARGCAYACVVGRACIVMCWSELLLVGVMLQRRADRMYTHDSLIYLHAIPTVRRRNLLG